MIKYFCDDCEKQFNPEDLKSKSLNGKKLYFCPKCINYQDTIVKLKEENPSELYCVTSFYNAKVLDKLCNRICGRYGLPIIYCSPNFSAQAANSITYGAASEDDFEEGYVGRMHGYEVFVSKEVDKDTAYIVTLPKELLDDLRQGTTKTLSIDTISTKGEYHIMSLR